MPAPIKYFRRDPNDLGRGSGLYYRRAATYKGKRYLGGYYSKYSEGRDKARKSTGFNIHPVGLPHKTRFPHTMDGNIRRR